MSRYDGFRHADVDTGLLADPKIVALARRLRDPQRTAAFAALYLATVLASWREGCRVSLEDASPSWWLDHPLDDARAALEEVGLLNDAGVIPDHAWESWFGPAWEWRNACREELPVELWDAGEPCPNCGGLH